MTGGYVTTSGELPPRPTGRPGERKGFTSREGLDHRHQKPVEKCTHLFESRTSGIKFSLPDKCLPLFFLHGIGAEGGSESKRRVRGEGSLPPSKGCRDR